MTTQQRSAWDVQRDSSKTWDRRYENGETSCASEVDERDPVEYTQHPFLYQHAIAKRLTGSLSGNPHDIIVKQFFQKKKERMLAIGCSLAQVEESFIRDDLVGEIVG